MEWGYIERMQTSIKVKLVNFCFILLNHQLSKMRKNQVISHFLQAVCDGLFKTMTSVIFASEPEVCFTIHTPPKPNHPQSINTTTLIKTKRPPHIYPYKTPIFQTYNKPLNHYGF